MSQRGWRVGLLTVTVTAVLASSAGTIHIQLQHAQVRVESDANPVLLRVLLECLQR